MANVKTPLDKYNVCKNRFIRAFSAGYTAVLRWCHRAIFTSQPRSPGAEYNYTYKKKLISKASNMKLSKGFFKGFFQIKVLRNEKNAGILTTVFIYFSV